MSAFGAIDDLEAMEFRGSDTRGGVPMATTVQVVVVVGETRQQASDTDDFELQITTAAAAKKNSMEKTAFSVAATAAIDLINLFFLLRGDTDTDTSERWRRRWGWTGGISVLFAFTALMTAANLVLALQTTVIVSAACQRVLLVASAAALFMASTGTVLLALVSSPEVYPKLRKTRWA